MQGERVREYLDANGVDFEETEHRGVITAQEVAAVEHESGWKVAKPVMIKLGNSVAMAIVPAPVQLDLDKARAGLGISDIEMASEDEFAPLFPDCDVGAEPIFGNVYGVPVYMDRSLLQDDYLVFRDGTHMKTLKVATSDFVRLVHPGELDLGRLPATN
jgi:Ala-tRNA(Pro) deacylase